MQSGGFSRGNGESYADRPDASLQELDRVSFRDLQKQVEGQITAFFKGEMVRGRTFTRQSAPGHEPPDPPR